MLLCVNLSYMLECFFKNPQARLKFNKKEEVLIRYALSSLDGEKKLWKYFYSSSLFKYIYSDIIQLPCMPFLPMKSLSNKAEHTIDKLPRYAEKKRNCNWIYYISREYIYFFNAAGMSLTIEIKRKKCKIVYSLICTMWGREPTASSAQSYVSNIIKYVLNLMDDTSN